MLRKSPCGGFSYDDEQIEFVNGVLRIKKNLMGGSGAGGGCGDKEHLHITEDDFLTPEEALEISKKRSKLESDVK